MEMDGIKGGKVKKVVEEVGKVGGISNPEELYAVYCFLLTELYIAGLISRDEMKIRRDIQVQGKFKCLMDYALGFMDGLDGVKRDSTPAYELGYTLTKGEKFYYENGDCMEVFTSIRKMLKDVEELRQILQL